MPKKFSVKSGISLHLGVYRKGKKVRAANQAASSRPQSPRPSKLKGQQAESDGSPSSARNGLWSTEKLQAYNARFLPLESGTADETHQVQEGREAVLSNKEVGAASQGHHWMEEFNTLPDGAATTSHPEQKQANKN